MNRTQTALDYHSPVKGVSVSDQIEAINNDLEFLEILEQESNDPLELLDLRTAIKVLENITQYLIQSPR